MANLFKEVLPKEAYAEGIDKKGAWILRDSDKDLSAGFIGNLKALFLKSLSIEA